MRREWLTGVIRDVHVASRGTYGYRRVHAELTQAHGVFVSANLVNLLMHNAAITGLPGPGKASRNAGVPTDDDRWNRRFNRDGLNVLWVSDITEHKTPWNPSRRREDLPLRDQGLRIQADRRLRDRFTDDLGASRECAAHGHHASWPPGRHDRS